MSTRAIIALPKDGVYHSIYCHFDGYDSSNGVGPTLRTWHNSREAADALIALGDVSALQGETVHAYYRDQHQAWHQCRPEVSATLDKLMERARDCNAKCLYIFQNDQWETTLLDT